MFVHANPPTSDFRGSELMPAFIDHLAQIATSSSDMMYSKERCDATWVSMIAGFAMKPKGRNASKEVTALVGLTTRPRNRTWSCAAKWYDLG